MKQVFEEEKRRAGIVFSPTIIHAQSFAAMLRRYGFKAEAISSETDARVRDAGATDAAVGDAGGGGCTGPTCAAATVCVGDQFARAIDALGEVRCWGKNRYGTLGDGSAAGATATVRRSTRSRASPLRP